MTPRSLLPLAAIFIAASSAFAAPITITNGGFTSGETGWTVVETTGEADSFYVENSNGNAAFGNLALFKDGIGNATSLYIQQNLSTANSGLTSNSFGSYTVNFDSSWRGDNNGAGGAQFQFSLINLNGGATLASQTFTLAPESSSGYPGMGTATPGVTFYRTISLVYDITAVTAGDIALRIARVDADTTSEGNNYLSTAWIDNVAVNTTAVPEPSTYGLLGAGALASVAFVRRRRR